jgi:hypothetical protein
MAPAGLLPEVTPATATVTRREVALVLLLGAVLAAYFTWPMAPKLGSVGRLELGDGQFSVWNVAWVAHAIVTPGVTMFDANIFHPHHGTLAYSEPNLGAGLIAVPAYLLSGGNPYAAHNSVVLASLTFTVLGMYLLARRLTGSREGALVAAFVFAFCPFFFARTAHIQLMMTAPMPFVLLAFHRLTGERSPLSAALLGIAIGTQALFCSYYGVLIGLLVGLGFVVYAAFDRRWADWRWWGLTAGAAVVSILTVLPFFIPYLRLQENTGFERTLGESLRYSADWRAYFASSAWAHDWMLPLLGSWREVLFPGFVALLVGGTGLAFAVRSLAPGGAAFPMSRPATVFYLLAFVIALWSSFGPTAGLYSVLYYTIPVFSLLRAPARFGLAVTLALSVFTAATVALAVRRLPASRGQLLTLALAVISVAELSTTIPFLPRRDVPRAYKVLASAEPGAVLELPFYHRPHERFRQTLYMLGSTAHWQPLVGGYSDFIPADFFEGAPLLETFPNAAAFAWLRERNTRYVVIHMNLYGGRQREQLLEGLDAYAEYLRPRYTFDSVRLYEIVAWPDAS